MEPQILMSLCFYCVFLLLKYLISCHSPSVEIEALVDTRTVETSHKYLAAFIILWFPKTEPLLINPNCAPVVLQGYGVTSCIFLVSLGYQGWTGKKLRTADKRQTKRPSPSPLST